LHVHLVVVTGLAGAGMTQTLKILEDIGFACIAQLPAEILDATLAHFEGIGRSRVALSVLPPEGRYDLLTEQIAALRTQVGQLDILFLDAPDEALLRRFSETRRRHPLAQNGTLLDAIRDERIALAPLRALATATIDTNESTLASLKIGVARAVGERKEAKLDVTLLPFGFKFGVPLELDLLFDVRFLANPNYDPILRERIGDDPDVARYIERDLHLAPFLEHLEALLRFLLPLYQAEGKARLTIGVGCTGGHHRSVYVAHRLAEALENMPNVDLTISPRDTKR